MSFQTADLFDQIGELARVPELQWRSVGRRQRFSGEVVTVKVFEDNSLVKEAFAEPGLGRVLVVDGGASMRRALVGDQLAAQAIAQGWVGVIISGCIRDRAMVETMDIGIRCLGFNPRKTEKLGQGLRDVPVEIGGVCIEPGDWVYADEDGVLFASHSLEDV